MGQGQSRPETWMELRPGMRPIRRKIEEVKRRRRERKLSIVSTAELLRQEEHDEIVNDESTRGDAGMEVWHEDEVTGSQKTVATAATAAEKVKEETTIDDDEKVATMVEEKETAAVTAAVQGKEEEEKGLEFGGEEDDDDDEKGRKFGSFSADEELPGSPSFRFYCKDLERDLEDDSLVKSDADGTRDTLPAIMEKEKKAYERGNSADSNSNEDLDIKPLKKDKGRRLRALTKAPGHVYNFLNVRNCCNNSCSPATNRDIEGLLDGKTDL